MTLTTPELDTGPARVLKTVFTALVVDNGITILEADYENASARCTAIVEVLLAHHDELAHQDLNDILAPFGGANADAALGLVLKWYVQHGVDVTVSLGTVQRDAGPACLYSVFTEYGDGTTLVEHYGSREERLSELRQRAFNLNELLSDEFLSTADEESCRRIIDGALATTRGRVLLFSARRHAEGESYSSYSEDPE